MVYFNPKIIFPPYNCRMTFVSCNPSYSCWKCLQTNCKPAVLTLLTDINVMSSL